MEIYDDNSRAKVTRVPLTMEFQLASLEREEDISIVMTLFNLSSANTSLLPPSCPSHIFTHNSAPARANEESNKSSLGCCLGLCEC